MEENSSRPRAARLLCVATSAVALMPVWLLTMVMCAARETLCAVPRRAAQRAKTEAFSGCVCRHRSVSLSLSVFASQCDCIYTSLIQSKKPYISHPIKEPGDDFLLFVSLVSDFLQHKTQYLPNQKCHINHSANLQNDALPKNMIFSEPMVLLMAFF
jgi:hypothetical protein